MTYDYNYGYYDYGTTATAATLIGGAILVPLLIGLAVSVFSIICMWKVFKKAGKQGWEAIIPIYNFIVLLQITELPMWYIALLFIPVGNVVALVLIYLELAKKFNKTPGFAVGLLLLNPIFMAILAFDKKCVFGGSAQVAPAAPAPAAPVAPAPAAPAPVAPAPVAPVSANPVVNEFAQPAPAPMPEVAPAPAPVEPVNPVVNEFAQPVPAPMPEVAPAPAPVEPVNPVVNEFTQPAQPQAPTTDIFGDINSNNQQ